MLRWLLLLLGERTSYNKNNKPLLQDGVKFMHRLVNGKNKQFDLNFGVWMLINVVLMSERAEINQRFIPVTIFFPGPDLCNNIMASKDCHPVQMTLNPGTETVRSLTSQTFVWKSCAEYLWHLWHPSRLFWRDSQQQPSSDWEFSDCEFCTITTAETYTVELLSVLRYSTDISFETG